MTAPGRSGSAGPRWTALGTVDGPTVCRIAAAAGVVTLLPVVLWVAAVGGNASGVAAALVIGGGVVGFAGCVAGLHGAPAAAAVALAAGVVTALAGAGEGVRLDAGPIAVLAVLTTELWGWSLDHRADLVTRDALRRRLRTLALLTCVGLAGSIAVSLLAGAGGGLVLRAAAVALVVAATAALVRDTVAPR